MSLPPLNSITGFLSAPLIGTWASSLLYTVEMLEAVYYFRHFANDDFRLKTLVTVAFVIDTVSALADYACVYLYTITHAGDPAYLVKQNWAIPLYMMCTGCVAILVQSFLTFRYWRFTNNTIVVALLSILILLAFGGTFASGLGVLLFPAFKDRTKVRVTGTVWLVTQVSVDLIIAAALVYELQKAKSKFMEGQQHRLRNTLNRLVRLAIQTGTATAVIAVASLITFLKNVETNIPTGIMYIVGRVYVLSMLLNLNTRVSANGEVNQGTSQAPTSVAFAHGTGTLNTDGLGGVQFRSAIVHIDSRQDSNGTFKSSNHTAEGPPAEIEMTTTNSSKQSKLLV
ncbi:hypothetical protein K438DRAFT_1993090 [Mycena galopus ATCC 62051]|nr:hypothetical protein K438DRAFT_1993090 [Mycena galopus ATCC 62051]